MLETRPGSNSYARGVSEAPRSELANSTLERQHGPKNNLLVGDVGESPRVQQMARFFFQDD